MTTKKYRVGGEPSGPSEDIELSRPSDTDFSSEDLELSSPRSVDFNGGGREGPTSEFAQSVFLRHYLSLQEKRRLDDLGWTAVIWDHKNRRFFGRSSSGWGKIMLFYLVFYAALAVFCAVLGMLFMETINDRVPTYTLDESVLSTPGFSIRPLGNYQDKMMVIKYNPENVTSLGPVIDSINAFTLRYAQATNITTDNLFVSCNDITGPGEKKTCHFNLKDLGPCTSENFWSYNSSSPCVLLKLNRVFGWQPVAYNIRDAMSTEDFPSGLLQYMEDMKKQRGSLPEMAWIWCEASEPGVTVEYYPSPGYPKAFYPFRNQEGYLSPLVALRIKDLPKDKVVKVSCQTVLKNVNHDLKTRKGAIRFALQRTMLNGLQEPERVGYVRHQEPVPISLYPVGRY